MEIINLDKEKYQGYKFKAQYFTDKYYDVDVLENGFILKVKDFPQGEVTRGFEDELFSEWLEDPVAFGIIENNLPVAFIEGSVEAWHKLFRISNIYVSKEYRRKGIADKLMVKMIQYAKSLDGIRGIILETQTCNFGAIQLYKKHGFKLTRIDLNEYSNSDVENKAVRIDLLLKI